MVRALHLYVKATALSFSPLPGPLVLTRQWNNFGVNMKAMIEMIKMMDGFLTANLSPLTSLSSFHPSLHSSLTLVQPWCSPSS